MHELSDKVKVFFGFVVGLDTDGKVIVIMAVPQEGMAVALFSI